MSLSWNPACFSSAFLLRKEVRGEGREGEHRRQGSLCRQLFRWELCPCLCHKLGLCWKYRNTFPFQIPASVLLAPIHGDSATQHHPPDFLVRSLAAWAPGNLACTPRDLGPTGNSPKPFSLDAAPYRWIINPRSECLILWKWHSGTDFALCDQKKTLPHYRDKAKWKWFLCLSNQRF